MFHAKGATESGICFSEGYHCALQSRKAAAPDVSSNKFSLKMKLLPSFLHEKAIDKGSLWQMFFYNPKMMEKKAVFAIQQFGKRSCSSYSSASRTCAPPMISDMIFMASGLHFVENSVADMALFMVISNADYKIIQFDEFLKRRIRLFNSYGEYVCCK